jgi:hypothetical protein
MFDFFIQRRLLKVLKCEEKSGWLWRQKSKKRKKIEKGKKRRGEGRQEDPAKQTDSLLENIMTF